MTAATLIQHLGLAEAVAHVLSKVASCHQRPYGAITSLTPSTTEFAKLNLKIKKK